MAEMNIFRYLFERDKKPTKGLLALEWVVMGYLVLTLLLMLFTYTKVYNPESMLWGRFRVVAMTVALWAVYRMLPCRFTRLCRVALQVALLSWWYPDTYELNRVFPNLDHRFAALEQHIFGSQPALWFADRCSHPVFSELMHMGYASYYPLMVIVLLYYFFYRYADFGRAAFVVLASFFAYYVIFVLLPVAGPQFYYQAVGLDDIARGVFPDLGHYFASHQECLPIPGWRDGFFYHLVVIANDAGERPTAAFPSSHVGVTTVLMLLAWHSRSRRLFFGMLPFFLLMCFATVYIQAHYAIDALAGLVTGVIIYFLLRYIYIFFRD